MYSIPCELNWTLKTLTGILKKKELKTFSNLLKSFKFKIYNPNPEERNVNVFNYNEVHNADIIDMST